jgi:anti-anti-sigma factor
MQFDILERDDLDGARRLTLTGELDLASAPTLRERLRELRAARRTVRLDLSKLDFMDSTGIAILARGLGDSAQDGWKLEVDRNVPRQILRLMTIAGIDDKLWPTNSTTPLERPSSVPDGPSSRQGTAPPLP